MPQGTAAPLSSRLLHLLVMWLAALGAGRVLIDSSLALLPAEPPAGRAAAAGVGVVGAAGPLAAVALVTALP